MSEADKDDFIIKPNGSMDFGYITEEIEKATNGELKKVPIRLKVGIETGRKGSQGLIHAKGHEQDAKNIGYNSIEDLIADVAQNFDSIYRKDNEEKRPDYRNTYTLIRHGDKQKNIKNKIAPVYFELIRDGEQFYVVITAFPKKDRTLRQQLKKEHLMYSSPAIGATVAPNGNPVSTPASNSVGAGQDRRLTSDISSVPSTSNVA